MLAEGMDVTNETYVAGDVTGVTQVVDVGDVTVVTVVTDVPNVNRRR